MLPKIDVPIYETKLVSTGQTLKFRPFLVKEQKLFLMASQSENQSDVVESIKQILNNCILTENFKVEELPIFELEYLFLQLRARSVGEVVDLKYSCNNKIWDDEGNEKTCGGVVKCEVNVLNITPKKSEGHTNKITITEKLGMMMKYPSFKSLEGHNSGNDTEYMDLIVDCIDFIYDDEQIYHAKDMSKEELVEFVESMTTKDFEKLEKFFQTMPRNYTDIHFKCPKCGYTEDIEVEGLQNFFV
jgi:hypothetical protein